VQEEKYVTIFLSCPAVQESHLLSRMMLPAGLFFKSHFSFSSPFQIKNYAEEETSEVGWDDLARQTF
jgi:hypothetical protein